MSVNCEVNLTDNALNISISVGSSIPLETESSV